MDETTSQSTARGPVRLPSPHGQREAVKYALRVRKARETPPGATAPQPGGLSLPIFIMAFLLALIVDVISLAFGALIALFGIGAPLVLMWRMIMSPFVAALMLAGGARGISLIVAAFAGFAWSTAAVIGVYVKGTVVREVISKAPVAGAAISKLAKAA